MSLDENVTWRKCQNARPDFPILVSKKPNELTAHNKHFFCIRNRLLFCSSNNLWTIKSCHRAESYKFEKVDPSPWRKMLENRWLAYFVFMHKCRQIFLDLSHKFMKIGKRKKLNEWACIPIPPLGLRSMLALIETSWSHESRIHEFYSRFIVWNTFKSVLFEPSNVLSDHVAFDSGHLIRLD